MVSGGGRLAVAGLWLAVALGLPGCASIVSGSHQVVSVDTPGCLGARCELSNDKGRFFVASTPGSVTLVRSYNNLQVSCSRDGASSEPLSVASTTKGMAFGNILFGGVIGAGVDMHSGAAYDYPQLISVTMACALPGTAAAPPPAPLGLQVDRPAAVDGVVPPGVRVRQVQPQSPAALAGLQPGDLILQFDEHPVRDPDALAALLAARRAALAADPAAPRAWDLLLRRGSENLVRRLSLPSPSN